MKIKAGTLFFVLLVSMLIGILMTSLILFSFYTRQKNNDDLAFVRLQVNIESTFNYLKSGCAIADSDTTYELDLFGEENDSVKVFLKPWGIFQVASVTAHHQSRSISKSCFMGYEPPDSNTALFLSTKKRDFTLSGDSRIYGNAIIPSRSINRGNAEGKYYSGDKLIYSGVVKQNTDATFPAPDQRLLKNVKLKIDSLKTYLRKAVIISPDSLLYDIPFYKPTIYLRPKGYKLSPDLNISGNVILCSDTLIKIPSSCKLNDIIIIAPSVVFENDFSGSVQVFCRDSIVTGNNCRFTYPSVLGLIKNEFSIKTPQVKTGDNNRVEGVLFTMHEVHDLNGSRISIGKSNHFTGIIYAQGQLELKPQSTVDGTVLAIELMLKTNSSQYSNNLLDVVINSSQLPDFFAGTILPPPNSLLNIVKWLPQRKI